MSRFDLTQGSIDQITIHKSSNGATCYISDKAKTAFFTGFVLNDKSTVQTVCEVDFRPSSISGIYIPRLTFKKIKKATGEEKQVEKEAIRISFSTLEDGYEPFWKMIGFLYKFKDLVDVGDFDRSFKVVDSDSFILQFKDRKQAEKADQLSKIFAEGDINPETLRMALLSTRAKTVNQFSDLLFKNSFDEYRSKFSDQRIQAGDEAVWHHFLKNNLWIIGLGIDIRFIRDLISEVNVGIPSTKGSGSPESDMLGITDYTLLVELKTSATNIFTSAKQDTARANTWSFTTDFIDGISQCLGQKSDWQKSHTQKSIVGNDGEIIDQTEIRTVDPKTVFIIGNKSREFPQNVHTVENCCKRDTFERFRRNNRNVDIVTFDELFEKAHYIVHGKMPLKTAS